MSGTGTITVAFQDAFNVEGNVSKTAAAALGGTIDSSIAEQVQAAASGGGAFNYKIDLTPLNGNVTTGNLVCSWRAPHDGVITDFRSELHSPTTTGNVTVTCSQSGTVVVGAGAPCQIDAGSKTSVGSAAPVTISAPDMFYDQELTFNITGQGDGTAKGLRVTLGGYRAAFGADSLPFFVGAQETRALGATVTAAWPDAYSPTVNDVAFLIANPQDSGGTAGTAVRPSGWNTMDSATGWGSIFWRRLDGSESGSGVAVSGTGYVGGTPEIAAMMVVFRNCVQLGTPYEAEIQNTGTGLTEEGQSIVTLGQYRLAVTFFLQYGNDASNPDTGWTQLFDQTDGAGVVRFSGDAQQVPTAAAVSADNRTITDSLPWATFTFALIPSPLV